jgi:uncharacterized protein YcfL
MRTLFTALLVLWLLVGCASPQEPENTPEEQIMAVDALYYSVIRAETFCAGAAL